MNKHTVLFAKATDTGINYPVLSKEDGDFILMEKFEPIPAQGYTLLGSCIIQTPNHEQGDQFKTTLRRACDSYCAAMHIYYC